MSSMEKSSGLEVILARPLRDSSGSKDTVLLCPVTLARHPSQSDRIQVNEADTNSARCDPFL